MCGIAGWVAFSRDLNAERATVESMVATMSRRGPDESGVWIDRHAALGHRRLAVIDIALGKQPMVAAHDAGDVALTYSGEIYNYIELRAELRARGHRFRTASDTEVVLRGYLEWGDAIAERLNGMYAFAIWDAARQRLVLIRDRLGVKPLYHSRTSDGVLFGSEPKAILANPHARKDVRLDGLREAFAWIRTPGHALWAGMREVRPGTVVTVTRKGLHERTYWTLEAREHPDDFDTSTQQVRRLLEDIVARQLVADVPRCTLLSGGLDSSVITALAQSQLGDAERIRSYAVDVVGRNGTFKGDRFRDTPDAPFALEVAAHTGTQHATLNFAASALAEPELRRAVVAARDLPTGFGDADNSLYLLFAAIRQHSTVALSGESADELFGGYRWMHDRAAQDEHNFPWVNHTHVTSPYTGTEVFDAGLIAQLDLPSYIEAAYDDARTEVPKLPSEPAAEARTRLMSYLHMTRYLRILLDRKDRLSMASGLEVRVPFCDHRLVEYVYNAPWSLKTHDGREKSLLRAAAKDLLPDSVLYRRKAPYPATQDPEYVSALQAHAAEVAGDVNHPVAPLTNRGFLREALRMAPQSLPAAVRTGLERWLDLAIWLEQRNPRLVLGG